MADTPYNVPDLAEGEIYRTEQTIKRSRFIASVARTSSAEEAKDFVARIKEEFSDARHNCWAYVAGAAGATDQVGASDDGEPKGTAGRPMLTVLTHSGIGELTVVVTRYFGGILLGTGGLVKAYQSTTRLALDALPLRKKLKTRILAFTVEHRFVNQIQRMISDMQGRVVEKEFAMDVFFKAEVEESVIDELKKGLVSLTNDAIIFEKEESPEGL